MSTTTYSIEEVEYAPYGVVKNYLYSGYAQLPYSVVVSFGLGLIFSVWSWGLFMLILFLIIFEIIYVMIIRQFTAEYMLVRFAIISSYVLGWAVGRVVIGDRGFGRYFYNDGFHEAGTPGHCHPTLKKRRNHRKFGGVVLRTDLVEEDGGTYCKYPGKVEEYVNNYEPPPHLYQWVLGLETNDEIVDEPILPIASSQEVDNLFNRISKSMITRHP